MNELLTDLRCRVCGDMFSAYRPSREEVEEPTCPACSLSTFDGVKKFLGIEQGRREPEPSEVN